MSKIKLQSGFDPTWKSDLLDLKTLGRTAFILRLIYRLYRDPTTNICVLSEYTIRKITGWDRESIRRARRKLVELSEIFPQKRCTFLVKSFHRFDNGRENRLPEKPYQTEKPSTNGRENRPEKTGKPSKIDGKPAHSIYSTQIDTDNTDRDSKNFSLDENVSDMVCLNCQTYEKHHVDSRGDTYGYCSALGSRLPPYLDAQACANFVKKKSKNKLKEGAHV